MRLPTSIGIAAALVLAAPPAGAHGGTLSEEGTTLVYTAASGELNDLTVASPEAGVIEFREAGRAEVGSITPRCVATRCDVSGVVRVEVRLGDGGDEFRTSASIPIVVEGGTGSDTYAAVASPAGPSQVDFRGGAGHDVVTYSAASAGIRVAKDEQPSDGRAGVDRDNIRGDVEIIQGSSHDDSLSGGPGPEAFISTGGTDTLDGRGGDDFFQMGSAKDGATTVIGGDGRDKVSYRGRRMRVRVSPDSDSTFDGEAGERDRVSGTEIVEGGASGDSLVAPATTTAGYELFGGRGNDRLVGGAGVDTIDCGSGRDRAEIDRRDRIANCELRLPGRGHRFWSRASLVRVR